MSGAAPHAPARRLSRRQAIAGGAALLTLTSPTASSASQDTALFDLERQVHAAAARSSAAPDAFAVAEQECWALVEESDAAPLETALARLRQADDDVDHFGQELDDLAVQLCKMPASGLAGLACKARVALWLEMDGLAELVLKDLFRLADEAHG